MSKDNRQSNGIRAGRIHADNVVSGSQIQGGDPSHAAELIRAAETLRHGEIIADEILAHNVISGLQYISDPAQANIDDLRKELSALRTQVEQAIAAQEIVDATDVEDLKASLATTSSELNKPQPAGNRILRKLDEANEIITKSAASAEAAGKISAQVIKLAPVVAMLWQVAQRIFGV